MKSPFKVLVIFSLVAGLAVGGYQTIDSRRNSESQVAEFNKAISVGDLFGAEWAAHELAGNNHKIAEATIIQAAWSLCIR